MSNANTYRKAVNTLKPSMNRMNAVREKAAMENELAKSKVAGMLAANGGDVVALYREANENRTEENSMVRVVLLGMLRKIK